jgi:hypothetical protein
MKKILFGMAGLIVLIGVAAGLSACGTSGGGAATSAGTSGTNAMTTTTFWDENYGLTYPYDQMAATACGMYQQGASGQNVSGYIASNYGNALVANPDLANQIAGATANDCQHSS